MIEIDDDIPEEVQERICAVKGMSDEEFFSLTPIWEINPCKMQAPIVNGAEWCDRYIIECCTNRVIELADNLHDCNFTRDMNNVWWEEDKFATTLLRWKGGLGVDPSTINVIRGRVSFTDGRHRAVLANILNHKRMLVSVHESTLEAALIILDGKVIKQDF